MIKLIAEIGINHNGNVEIAKKLIDIASFAGLDYVKFQKRDPEICVPEKQKYKPKILEDGTETTYLQYKHMMEFSRDQYTELKCYCIDRKVEMFASVWDMPSAAFMKEFTDTVKIPSALITDHVLLEYCRSEYKTVLISTGMSTEDEISDAVKVGKPDVIFHTNSGYPSPICELNFKYIQWLRDQYPGRAVGYSGHEHGLSTTYSIVPVVDWIERHVTLDHDMWGSDQKSSVDPVGLIKMVRSIRDIEKAHMTGYAPRECLKSEKSKRESLRG